ncbi:hypothetical protein Tco_0904550 [Tanacetum coccineum]
MEGKDGAGRRRMGLVRGGGIELGGYESSLRLCRLCHEMKGIDLESSCKGFVGTVSTKGVKREDKGGEKDAIVDE